ncbi:DUF4265 domain-containing protein [Paenibacillus tengchongensis]|uniref:DUF4265 domain-containing protein n=1 Tax=Paenibacillus tengchongensis TaxID=2608684 RepID=UPI00124C829D|nr:DUF4265 domain-containing protein [Paenibacillus tengchongensis]
MPDIMGLHICFDEQGREIEILDVTPVSRNEYRIEETPLFHPALGLGDIIRVKEKQGVFYYVETVRKSGYLRHAWLLSQEAAESREIKDFTGRVARQKGRWEQIFGGVLIVHLPAAADLDAEAEMARILRRYKL